VGQHFNKQPFSGPLHNVVMVDKISSYQWKDNLDKKKKDESFLSAVIALIPDR
jgi:hypothetical protein